MFGVGDHPIFQSRPQASSIARRSRMSQLLLYYVGKFQSVARSMCLLA